MTQQHGYRAKPTALYVTCRTHQKLAYSKRADARAAARRLHDSGLREYPCTRHKGHWHVGHMPPPVKRGECTAAEWFDLPRKERARRWALETAERPGVPAPGLS